jgi:hypothetical protein
VNHGADITDVAQTMRDSRVHDGGMCEAAPWIFVRVNVEVRQNSGVRFAPPYWSSAHQRRLPES